MPATPANFTGWCRARNFSPWVTAAYAALVLLFVATVALFYLPGKGFTYAIAFGALQQDKALPEVRNAHPYVQRASSGYDAQYYAQIAIDPTLRHPGLNEAVDSLPYRARRILFSATAYVLGLGRPAWILQAFSLQNALCWLLLAALLLHWFPPVSWENFVRWTGVLFTSGLCISVHNALFDGPSLLLIAFAVYLLERGRPGWATFVLALAGLGRETNLLAIVALAPEIRAPRREWLRAAARALLAVLPLALWLGYVRLTVGSAADPGTDNFALPFTGYVHKWREVFAEQSVWLSWNLLIVVALTVQLAFVALRRNWNNAWWRVSAAFGALMICLGDAVWEGYPGAASRVLLPLQLGFNVLLPRGRAWLVLLLLGNITLWVAPEALRPPPAELCQISGPRELREGAKGTIAAAKMSDNWFDTEGSWSGSWAWAPGSAEIILFNPQRGPVEFDIGFGLSSALPRNVRVLLGEREIWTGETGKKITAVAANALVLQPGENRLEFQTDDSGYKIGSDVRTLAFCLHNLRVEFTRASVVPASRRP